MEHVDQEVRMARARRIRAARTDKLKATQDKLAGLCGWNGGARISNYESGDRVPSSDHMRRIAIATDTSYFYLQFGVGSLDDPYWETRPEPEKIGQVDTDQLSKCIAAIEATATRIGTNLDPDQIARLAVHIYAEWSIRGEQPGETDIEKLVKLLSQ